MKSCMSKLCLVAVLLASSAKAVHDVRCPSDLDLRIGVSPGAFSFICKVSNSTRVDVDIVRSFLWSHHNNIILFPLEDINRRPISLSANRRIGPDTLPDTVVVPIGEMREFRIVEHDLIRRRDAFAGRYACWIWSVLPWRAQSSERAMRSNPIFLASPDAEGQIAPPVVDHREAAAKPVLAFIHHEGGSHELGFLLFNGAGEGVVIEKPLTRESRIVATAPAIRYTRELFFSDMAAERVVVESDKVGEWRLPWKTVLDLIPKEDLERIRASGGDLDLVWKVGEYSSDPLPLNLAKPPPEPAP